MTIVQMLQDKITPQLIRNPSIRLYHVKTKPHIQQGMKCYLLPYQTGNSKDFTCIITQDKRLAESAAVDFLAKRGATAREIEPADLGNHWEMIPATNIKVKVKVK